MPGINLETGKQNTDSALRNIQPGQGERGVDPRCDSVQWVLFVADIRGP